MRWAGWWWAGVFCSVSVACGGGSPGGGSDGGGTAITVPDGGPSDGGPTADCSGLLPAAPGPAVTFDVPANPGEICTTAIGDGEGVIAADAQPPSASLKRWFEFSPSYGSHSGSFQAPPQLFAQPAGYIGLYGVATYWDRYADGALAPGNAAALGRAYASGVVAFSTSSAGLTARKLDVQDKLLVEVASATVTAAGAPIGGAEDASGAVLALTASGSGVSGLWIDLAKATAGPTFAIGTGAAVSARPLLGGGVAVQLDGRWTATVKPGETTPLAGPSWAGDAADFVPVRGGKAYALMPSAGSAIQIVTPQGNSCGSVTFRGVTSVFVGLDGSVVGSTGASGCTKVVWRNVLR